jgi:DNA-binding transcriptional LysR family regulator
MTIDDLRAFAALIRHGSLTRAATHMGLTQPAITRRIQRLEKALGGSLLDRSVKPARLSTLGMSVYERAQAVLSDFDKLKDLMTAGTEPEGALRLGASQSISDLCAVPTVTLLKRRFPKLRIEIQPDWSAGLLKKVQIGLLDAAATMVPSSTQLPAGIDADFIATQPTAIVAPKSSPLRGQLAFRQLASYPWVVYPEGGCIYRTALEREHQARQLAFNVAVSDYGAERQLALVAAGAGLGMVPEMMLRISRYREKVRALRITDFAFDFDIWVIRPPFLGHLSAPVKLFGEVVTRCCGPARNARKHVRR